MAEVPAHQVMVAMKALRMAESIFSHAYMQTKDGEFNNDLAIGLNTVISALEDIAQSLSARIERLHQKIDRIEKKLGTA